MKILFDYQAWIQRIGGVSRYHTELMRFLPQYGIEPYLPCIFSDNIYLDEIGQSHFHPFQSNHSNFRLNCFKWINQQICKNEIKHKNYDIIHPTFVNPYYVRINKNKPVVVTVHDLIHEKIKRPDSTRVKAKRREQLQDATAIICISEQTKQDLLSYYDFCANKKIYVVYHGSCQEIITCDSSPLFEFPYLLYIGGRKSYKNFCNFARAFSLLPKDFHLVCTGAVFTNEEINLLNTLGIRMRVHQMFVTDKELENLLFYAQAFVYPSMMEGFGIPILEAFRSGCPAIISNIKCFHEVGGDAVVYFDPNDVDSIAQSISNTIFDESKKSELKQKGYMRLKEFTWNRTAELHANVYKSLVF